MKTISKVIIGLLLVTIITGFVGGLLISKYEKENNNQLNLEKINIDKEFDLEGIDKINLDLYSQNLIIKQSSDNKLKLHYELNIQKNNNNKNNKTYDVIFETSGDKITIKDNENLDDFNIYDDLTIFNLNFDKHLNSKLIIEIPENKEFSSLNYNNINITNTNFKMLYLDSKELNIDNVKVLENSYFKTSSRNVKINNLETNNLEIKTSSGNIVIDNLISKSNELITSSGNIKLDNFDFEKTNIKTSSGNIDFNIKKIEYLDIDTSSGDVKLKLPENPNLDLNYKTSSGNLKTNYEITTKYLGEKPNYKKGLSGKIGLGGKTFNIKTSSGNLELN